MIWTMTFAKLITYLLVASLGQLLVQEVRAETRYYIKVPTNLSSNQGPSSSSSSSSSESFFEPTFAAEKTPRLLKVKGGGESTSFDPELLNKFLEEYALKVKRPITSNSNSHSHSHVISDRLDTNVSSESDEQQNDNAEATTSSSSHLEAASTNDTAKRNKFYNANSDNRNTGWVTLDAVPWSKSKISKWQANPTPQASNNWPDGPGRPAWDRPNYASKPNYNPDYADRFPSPASSAYESKPWQNKYNKPQYADTVVSSNIKIKPWYNPPQDRPFNYNQNHPSYSNYDKYEENPNQAQKWPPERPSTIISQSWDRYSDSRPASSSIDIITDNRPANFPTNFDRDQRPTYTHHTESFVNEHSVGNGNGGGGGGGGGWTDRNDYVGPTKFGRPVDDYFDNRPHFPVYKYPNSYTQHRPSLYNHPMTGEGQWVLLSTNHGYTKNRQRSIKFDSKDPNAPKRANGLISSGIDLNEEINEPHTVPQMTSKRQVRLTVLPSLNGTNTTTSHGGLLEVEKTFKTVEQSRRDYEKNKANSNKKPATVVIKKKRPVRNSNSLFQPSNSAVLAAVGAGMLPATMAMMIPMVLGRRKRSVEVEMPEDLLRRLAGESRQFNPNNNYQLKM